MTGTNLRAEVKRRSDRATLVEHLARSYSTALTMFFRRRVSNPDDIPDLIQNVFLRLSRLNDVSSIREPERYLFKTANSALQDQRRRDASRQRHAHQELDEAIVAGSELSPERVIAGRFAVQELHDAIARLPERTRDIFVLRAIDDLKTKDIAVAFGISQRAVEKHYAKALARITLALKAHRNA